MQLDSIDCTLVPGQGGRFSRGKQADRAILANENPRADMGIAIQPTDFKKQSMQISG